MAVKSTLIKQEKKIIKLVFATIENEIFKGGKQYVQCYFSNQFVLDSILKAVDLYNLELKWSGYELEPIYDAVNSYYVDIYLRSEGFSNGKKYYIPPDK